MRVIGEHRSDFVRVVLDESFYRGEFRPVRLHGEEQAGTHSPAIERRS
jgi:hypothetical protein